MPYHRTLREDVDHAREILAKGKAAHDEVAYLSEELRAAALPYGAIYGKDVYAAYQLLQSFVEVIEAVDVKVCEVAMRARQRGRELDLSGIPAGLPDEQGPTTRPDYLGIDRGECYCRTCGHAASNHDSVGSCGECLRTECWS